jgi:LemA protein
MPTSLVLLVVAALVAVVVIGWFVAAYNGLVSRRQQVESAGAQVDVQLKRRHDLIPNLVETVKGYAAHERSTLDSVTAARQHAMVAGGGPRQAQAAAEGELTGALSRLLAVAEAYPDLKASTNFGSLQAELATTEDKIAYARQFLNGAIQTLNTAVQSFPTSLVAGLTGFRTAGYFQAGDDERGPVAARF